MHSIILLRPVTCSVGCEQMRVYKLPGRGLQIVIPGVVLTYHICRGDGWSIVVQGTNHQVVNPAFHAVTILSFNSKDYVAQPRQRRSVVSRVCDSATVPTGLDVCFYQFHSFGKSQSVQQVHFLINFQLSLPESLQAIDCIVCDDDFGDRRLVVPVRYRQLHLSGLVDDSACADGIPVERQRHPAALQVLVGPDGYDLIVK